jgi:hypothetical protein
MRHPSITIVLRGNTDRFGFQKLYLRYARNYKRLSHKSLKVIFGH